MKSYLNRNKKILIMTKMIQILKRQLKKMANWRCKTSPNRSLIKQIIAKILKFTKKEAYSILNIPLCQQSETSDYSLVILSIEISLVCFIGSHFIFLVNRQTILIGIQVRINIGKVIIPVKVFLTFFLLYLTTKTAIKILTI